MTVFYKSDMIGLGDVEERDKINFRDFEVKGINKSQYDREQLEDSVEGVKGKKKFYADDSSEDEYDGWNN